MHKLWILFEEEVWSSSDSEEETANSDNVANRLPSLHSPLNYLLIFLVLWQSAFKVSNVALTTLIRFLKFFVLTLGRAFQVNSIIELASNVPKTHAQIHKALGFDVNDWCTELRCLSKMSLHI